MKNSLLKNCLNWSPPDEERPYEKPSVEIIEVMVEKGFADSTTDLDDETW